MKRRIRKRIKSGAETHVQAVPLDGGGARVAATAVDAYLTGATGDSAPASAIGGVDVRAELRDGQVVCTAGLSGFGAGDLVVLRVDVAIFRVG
jgi:hypothetical protein